MKRTRGVGNCGEVTNRGEEAESADWRLLHRPTNRQDPPGYEQKLDTRPTILGEWAADHETKPEDGAQVDRELGRGQITCSWQQERPLFGEGFILCPLVELAPTRGETWQHVFASEVGSRGHSSDLADPNGDAKA